MNGTFMAMTFKKNQVDRAEFICFCFAFQRTWGISFIVIYSFFCVSIELIIEFIIDFPYFVMERT